MLTDRAANRFIIMALFIIASLMVRMCSQFEARASSRAVFEDHVEIPKEVRDMKTTWKYYIVEGVKAECTVETSKLDSETLAEWAARHKAAVDAMKVEFPPV